ncbi:hypothetical protein EVA_08067 [gut metagenome]|uniref:Uncharacterized protein n=1 Tax=gut metagenome TaxID=749906 RepID=J9G987_9ZZZZ
MNWLRRCHFGDSWTSWRWNPWSRCHRLLEQIPSDHYYRTGSPICFPE